jgi:hypothetical protein
VLLGRGRRNCRSRRYLRALRLPYCLCSSLYRTVYLRSNALLCFACQIKSMVNKASDENVKSQQRGRKTGTHSQSANRWQPEGIMSDRYSR